MANSDAVTANGLVFNYGPPPDNEKKLILLTTGRVAIVGRWGDGHGVIGWHPLPKRDKQFEEDNNL